MWGKYAPERMTTAKSERRMPKTPPPPTCLFVVWRCGEGRRGEGIDVEYTHHQSLNQSTSLIKHGRHPHTLVVRSSCTSRTGWQAPLSPQRPFVSTGLICVSMMMSWIRWCA
jgi:hypothetical protein